MTKKRYIKLLMSRGFSRNEAREMAWDIAFINKGFSRYNKAQKAEGKTGRLRLETYLGDYEGMLVRR